MRRAEGRSTIYVGSVHHDSEKVQSAMMGVDMQKAIDEGRGHVFYMPKEGGRKQANLEHFAP